jgi:DNA-binding transcriptional LysR family regulator
VERWHGIELRHLLALDAVAREGSFRGASARLGYVPSAVSQQIAALEKIVGERLIERSRGSRTVGLTAAGELVLRHAEPIIARVQAAQADLASLADGAAGMLRVGITQSAGVRILPSLMHRFAPAWPGIELRPSEAESDIALYDLLERGDLELAFVELPAPPGPFETTQLYVDPYVLVVPADHPLARLGRTPSLAEIGGLKLVGHTQCRGLRRVEAQLRARGAEVEYVFRSDVNATVQSLVAAGIGAAIVPALAVDLGDRRTVVFDLSRHVPPRTLALAWHRDRQRSPAALAFSDAAHAVCAQLAAPQPTVRAV